MGEDSGARLAFVDCETTGLDPARHEIWELAYILEPEGKSFRALLPVTLSNADPAALEVGGFHQRYPQIANHEIVDDAYCRRLVLRDLSVRVLVGNNPQFDASFLAAWLGSRPWHYHLVDVKALVAGRLGIEPPWHTSELLEACGLDPMISHHALGVAEQARAMYHWAYERVAA